MEVASGVCWVRGEEEDRGRWLGVCDLECVV